MTLQRNPLTEPVLVVTETPPAVELVEPSELAVSFRTFREHLVLRARRNPEVTTAVVAGVGVLLATLVAGLKLRDVLRLAEARREGRDAVLEKIARREARHAEVARRRHTA